MKIKSVFFAVLIIFLAKISFAGLIVPTAKVTVKVVDSQGSPIEDAKVRFQFYVSNGWGKNTKFVEGTTGKNGQFSGEGASLDYCNIHAEKEGYYDSNDEFHFSKVATLNRWEPWNPTVEIALKEIKTPIAMYAKRTGDLKVPVLEKPVGYDLEKGDWVAPYGAGVISDLIFTCKARFVSRDNWDCSYKLSFPNAMDGIQEFIADKSDRSRYRWPYEALETGYKKELTWAASFDVKNGYKTDFKDHRRFIFRVRTKIDEKGNIISAYYGKFEGDISFFAGGFIKFEYYFNPSGTRNLEYDRNKSLFKWKKIDEIDQFKVNGP